MIEIASGGLCPSNNGACFPNMAGRGCDNATIEDELLHAGIEVVTGPVRDAEVATNRTGTLGPFTFTRAWYYWCVSGPMPLDVARKLYADPVGREDVRVAGHCGCPPPDEWADFFDAEGNMVVSDPDGKLARDHAAFIAAHPQYADGDMMRYVPNAADVAVRAIIDTYHIDSQAGLDLFARAIKDHKLHEVPHGQ